MSIRTSALLRAALANLAADPEQQSQRLAGAVIRDELALEFGDAYDLARGATISIQLVGNCCG
jgi:hypothetical protein